MSYASRRDQKSKDDDDKEIPIVEFECEQPEIRFYDFKKISETSDLIRKIHEDIVNFSQEDIKPKFFRTCKSDSEKNNESLSTVQEKNEDEAVENDNASDGDESKDKDLSIPLDTEILSLIPPMAPSFNDSVYPVNCGFDNQWKKQERQRFDLAYMFRQSENRLMSNYYDSIAREKSYDDETINQRPLSLSLNYISQKGRFPYELLNSNSKNLKNRLQALNKSIKNSLKTVQSSHDYISTFLQVKQQHELQAFIDVNRITDESFNIPRVPSEIINDDLAN